MKRVLSAFALLCALNAPAAIAAPHYWRTLTPVQQEALAPMSQQWDALPEAQQHHLLKVAKHYPDLSMEGKQRFLSRLGAWSRLSPEQRQAARDKYRAFSKVPEEKRNQVRQIIKEGQTGETQQSGSINAARSTTATPPPATGTDRSSR